MQSSSHCFSYICIIECIHQNNLKLKKQEYRPHIRLRFTDYLGSILKIIKYNQQKKPEFTIQVPKKFKGEYECFASLEYNFNKRQQQLAVGKFQIARNNFLSFQQIECSLFEVKKNTSQNHKKCIITLQIKVIQNLEQIEYNESFQETKIHNHFPTQFNQSNSYQYQSQIKRRKKFKVIQQNEYLLDKFEGIRRTKTYSETQNTKNQPLIQRVSIKNGNPFIIRPAYLQILSNINSFHTSQNSNKPKKRKQLKNPDCLKIQNQKLPQVIRKKHHSVFETRKSQKKSNKNLQFICIQKAKFCLYKDNFLIKKQSLGFRKQLSIFTNHESPYEAMSTYSDKQSDTWLLKNCVFAINQHEELVFNVLYMKQISNKKIFVGSALISYNQFIVNKDQKNQIQRLVIKDDNIVGVLKVNFQVKKLSPNKLKNPFITNFYPKVLDTAKSSTTIDRNNVKINMKQLKRVPKITDKTGFYCVPKIDQIKYQQKQKFQQI